MVPQARGTGEGGGERSPDVGSSGSLATGSTPRVSHCQLVGHNLKLKAVSMFHNVYFER